MLLNFLGGALLVFAGIYAGSKLKSTDAIILIMLVVVGNKLLWLE